MIAVPGMLGPSRVDCRATPNLVVFASLSAYQAAHFKHHLSLGSAGDDPDLLPIPAEPPPHWLTSYLRNVLVLSAWCGSFAGHLVARGVPISAKFQW